MNRHLVAGMLGLVLAGCTLDRSSGKRPNLNMPAVEMTPPLPSIHEAINQENPDADRESLRAEVARTVADPTEVDAEIGESPSALSRRNPGRVGVTFVVRPVMKR